MKKITPFLIAVLSIFLNNCKKESISKNEKTLILGKWTGIKRISKITYKSNINNSIEYLMDSTLCKDNGPYFWIEFKADSVTTTSHLLYPGSWEYSLRIPQYTINAKKLNFECNPFTTKEFQNCINTKSSTIELLTNNSLVLYDIDTLGLSPLYIKEVWFNFYK